jgi:hypothetical protein
MLGDDEPLFGGSLSREPRESALPLSQWTCKVSRPFDRRCVMLPGEVATDDQAFRQILGRPEGDVGALLRLIPEGKGSVCSRTRLRSGRLSE